MNPVFNSFKANTLQGKEISMETYQGKTILVVNTASKCGLTPQFEGLEELYQKYKQEDFVILGFPCNQFANQEPGDEKSISEGCMINYGVTFPMFAKIDVNGKNAHPIYKYLKSNLGGWFGSSIKWNFTKFLIDSNGNPVKRYAPNTKPKDIESDILGMLRNEDVESKEVISHNPKTNIFQSIGRIILGAFILYAGIGHMTWLRTEFLAQVPTWLPVNQDLIVILSGLVEIALGASLLFYAKRSVQIGLTAAIFFILVFPGNISQYMNGINAFGLNTDKLRFIRLFFQPVLILLALWSTGALNFWKQNGLKSFFN
jgi:glutathione peroxidase